MVGKIHSFESFGTVDGPGIRFVIFFKGCPLRCLYCHNPDTWTFENSQEYSVDEVIAKSMKYKNYWGDKGGITLTGGEPLLQIDFIIELLKKYKELGVNTALDTSGALFEIVEQSKFDELIKYVDLFLLDIKHIDNNEHIKLTGKNNQNILKFARYLSDNNKDMWIRHVIVPGINLEKDYLIRTKKFIDSLKTVKKIEILPYHTLGINKYSKLGLEYKLKDTRVPTKEEIKLAKDILINGKI